MQSYKEGLKQYLNRLNIIYSNVYQVGNKQMAIVVINNIEVLFSYYTCLGINSSHCYIPAWKTTKKKYSITTTNQINQFLRNNDSQFNAKIDNEDLIELLTIELGIDKRTAFILANFQVKHTILY